MSLISSPINETEAAAEKFGENFFKHLAVFVDHLLDRLFRTQITVSISERKDT
jgi:hypothetical protein